MRAYHIAPSQAARSYRQVGMAHPAPPMATAGFRWRFADAGSARGGRQSVARVEGVGGSDALAGVWAEDVGDGIRPQAKDRRHAATRLLRWPRRLRQRKRTR